MLPWLQGLAADPGRVHTEGRMARAAVETAREQVAALVGARPREVVFTSGATEAVNAAVWGAGERGTHVIAPAVEHSGAREHRRSRAHRHHQLGVRRAPPDPIGERGIVHRLPSADAARYEAKSIW